MQAAPVHTANFGIHYDKSVLREVTPTKLVLLNDEPAAIIGETENTYIVLQGEARVATIPEDSELWKHTGLGRVFDREYLMKVPAIREVPKDKVSEFKCWYRSGINWDNYYALNKEDLPADPYSTDGRFEIHECEFFGFKVYNKHVHNVRW